MTQFPLKPGLAEVRGLGQTHPAIRLAGDRGCQLIREVLRRCREVLNDLGPLTEFV